MLGVALGLGDVARSWPDLLAVTRAAEERGFVAVALPDHPNTPGLAPEVALAALAARTSRIRLWPNVLAVGYRAPSLLARITAAIDVVSNGRLDVGLGTGWDREEFAAYGFVFEEQRRRDLRLSEAIQILRLLWSEERPSFAGQTWDVRDAVCEPKPVQRPHPSIWVGSLGGRRALRAVVAPLADGCNLALPFARRRLDVGRLVDEVRSACDEIGRDPATLAISANLVVADAGTRRELIERGGLDPAAVLALEEPHELADRLASLEVLGMTRVMLGLRSGAPLDDVERLASAFP